MNLITLFRKISPYVKPYRWLVVLTLILTIIGSLIAQINAVVLARTVDAIATEQIKASIDAIKRNRTVIIISHSISQIIDSDIIYAMKEGRVEQSGHPDILYRKGGVYRDIVDASARNLNIDKLAQTLDADGDGVMFD